MTAGKQLEQIRRARRLKERLADASLRAASRQLAEAREAHAEEARKLREAENNRMRHRLFTEGEVLSVHELDARRADYSHLLDMEQKNRTSAAAARKAIAMAENAATAAQDAYRTERFRAQRIDEWVDRVTLAERQQQGNRDDDEAAENHQNRQHGMSVR